MIAKVKLVLDPSVRDLCRCVYPGHPKGCPNFGKKRSCPPQAPLINELLDAANPVWAFWINYDLAAHRERMRCRHPRWSERQLVNCLYWQPRVDKLLRQLVDKRLPLLRMMHAGVQPRAVYCPEACGVNVTATMESAHVKLEWPPVDIVRKIALVGTAPRKDPQ